MSAVAHVPPGWSANPSAWSQRIPIVVLAVIGAIVATYLALFQTGGIASVWEPFFGRGSERILTSRVSDLLPIPDAALGAAGYADPRPRDSRHYRLSIRPVPGARRDHRATRRDKSRPRGTARGPSF